MAIRIMPTAQIEPVRSQAGGIIGRVEPMHDFTGAQLQQVGEGAQDLGRAVTVLARKNQDTLDIAQSQRMRNLYDVENENELQAPGTGFLNTVGMDANKERRDQSFNRLKEKRKSIEALAQNDVQRMNFAEHADRVDAESRLRADVHQEREGKHFLAGETKTSAELGIKRGIKLVGTDEGDIAVAGAMRDLDNLADIYGWPKDSKLRKDMKQDAMDSLHAGVIDQYTQDPQTAPTAALYLAKHKDEMSPNTLTKAVEDVRRAVKLGKQEQIDAAAWSAASNLAASGASLEKQRAAIDQSVRTERMTPEVAMKTWALLQNFDDQKWQGVQRDRASMRQNLEQQFGKNPDLGVDMLPAETQAKIDELGLRSDVFQIHNEVRLHRLADLIGEGSQDSLVLARDMRSVGEMRQMIDFLEKSMPTATKSIDGKSSLSVADKQKAERIKKTIDQLTEQATEIALRPHTYVMRDDNHTPMPNNAPKPAPINMQQFTESIRKALYPGSGR